jgi:4-amino-4-deoxy-L-arabinose transferase-like glycosyltransferase
MTPIGDTLLAVILALVLHLFITSRIRAGFGRADAVFLVKLYWWAVGLRGALALVLNQGAAQSSFAEVFWGDSSTYDYGGLLLSIAWSGDSLVFPLAERHLSGYGFHYFVGFIYYLFGRNVFLVQLINGAIGALAAVVIYAIALGLFGSLTARWAARFMAFFPQMVFWSCAMYKDPAILLSIALCMYAVLRLRRRFAVVHLLLFVAAALALVTLRFYIFYMVAFATLGTFLFSQRRGPLGSLTTQLLLGVALLAGITLGVRRETLDQQTSYLDLARLQNARRDQVAQGQSAFGAQYDVSTVEGAMVAVPVGLVYLLFAPFPWSISGLRQILTLPETLVWYALMPALARGLRYTIRHRFREMLPILVFAGTLTLSYSVFQSNVGTAYRQRTQITMFFFILMGAGIELKRGGLRSGPEVPPDTPTP